MFESILFPPGAAIGSSEKTIMPDSFKDLNLDQVSEAALEAAKDADLSPYWYAPLSDRAVIRYRQDVLRDLEDRSREDALAAFSTAVWRLSLRAHQLTEALTGKDGWDDNHYTRGRFLECVLDYADAVESLDAFLRGASLRAAGLVAFREHVSAYIGAGSFARMAARARALREAFDKIQYCMLLQNGTVKVRQYEGQKEARPDIEETFARFRQKDAQDYRQKLYRGPGTTHIEAAVLGMLARYDPDEFTALTDFSRTYIDFLDAKIVRFAREIQFYLGWIAYIRPMREAGLPFCYPDFTDSPSEILFAESFDVALARRVAPVTNDFAFAFPERIAVVTGPNQGGKTTFARMVGQLHHLAAIGLCVPGTRARLFLCDRVLTHFERQESLATLNGKLMDELVRLKAVLSRATPRSLVIVNEIFSSTTLADALDLGGRMMRALCALKIPVVLVTFLDELASFSPEVASLMSTVDPDDAARRTYKVVRRAADGLAYALQIAARHRLTYETLKGRLAK